MAGRFAHFSHPNHYFWCDLCSKKGSGLHYRCDTCNFDIHDYCFEFPKTLKSFHAHPWHDLILYANAAPSKGRLCDLCMEHIEGFFYRCTFCGFDAHPDCTTRALPKVRSNLHPGHDLYLEPAPAVCSACDKGDSRIWFYRCGECEVSLHMGCLDGPTAKPNVCTHFGETNTRPQTTTPDRDNGTGSSSSSARPNNATSDGSGLANKILLDVATGTAAKTFSNILGDIFSHINE